MGVSRVYNVGREDRSDRATVVRSPRPVADLPMREAIDVSDLSQSSTTATKKPRPRSFKAALALWPEAVGEVQANPCDVSLGALCSLLDVMDAEIVRGWESDGHAWRRAVFSECRAAARQANAYVAATTLAGAQERGRKMMAARQAAKAAAL